MQDLQGTLRRTVQLKRAFVLVLYGLLKVRTDRKT